MELNASAAPGGMLGAAKTSGANTDSPTRDNLTRLISSFLIVILGLINLNRPYCNKSKPKYRNLI